MKKLIGILVTSLALGGTAVGTGVAIKNNNEVAQQAVEQAGVEQVHDVESELDAETGNVLEKETERADDAGKKQQTTTDDIGRDKAKEIALQQAGVAEEDVTWVKVERDYDDGRLEYKVEFRLGNKEYEYEVDAKTGQVFERDVDVEDDFDDRYDDDWDDIFEDDRYDDWDDRWDD